MTEWNSVKTLCPRGSLRVTLCTHRFQVEGPSGDDSISYYFSVRYHLAKNRTFQKIIIFVL